MNRRLVPCVTMAAGLLLVAPDCGRGDTLCVDDAAGPQREFISIQDAVDAARPGDRVVVFDGAYEGFRVKRSGTARRQLEIVGMPGAVVVGPESESNDGIHLADVSWVTVEGFEVAADGMNFGIAAREASARHPMRGLRIRDNNVHDAESTNIYLSQVSDSLIEGNVATASKSSHGIYLANGGSDATTLRRNTCSGNAKNGIHFNGDASVDGDGLHTGLEVDGNTIFGNAANGIDADGVRDSTFSNNLIYGNGRHGVRAFAIDAAAGPAGLVIANNTIADNLEWAVKLSEDEGGHVVFNNILLSRRGALAVESDDLLANWNIGKRFSSDGGDERLGLNGWRSSGHGADSLRASRRKVFNKPGKADYSLRRNSSAVDRGTRRADGARAPKTAIDGGRRPLGLAYDIGAYELDPDAGKRSR